MAQPRAGRLIDWLFRNRKTGRITIGQLPNVALGLFLAATVLQWLLDLTGSPRAGLRLVATGALVWWGVDEVVRGVNPWRRLLGGSVLAAQAAKLVG